MLTLQQARVEAQYYKPWPQVLRELAAELGSWERVAETLDVSAKTLYHWRRSETFRSWRHAA